MPRYQATPPDADTLRRAQERASLNAYAQEWDEPPTHLPVEPNVVVGEIAPPLYLDEDDQRSINGAIINRHSVVSRHSVSRSEPSAPTPIRTRPKATPAPELRSEQPTPASKHRKVPEGPSIAVHAGARAEAARATPPREHEHVHVKPADKQVQAAPAPAPAPVPPPVQAAPKPAPQSPPQPPPPPGPMPQMPGVDPLLIPTPPELAPVIFSWVRRLALQLDLKNADRMLRDALLDVTSSLSVAIVYPGADELYSLAGDEEVPADPTPLVMVAQARRAMIASHTAIIPIMTTGETVGVILLQRNPRNPGYTPIEQVSMLCLSREVAAIMHNLATEHVQRTTEVKADAGSLYRGEALEAHRSRGQEGHALNLSPGWVRRTYPLLLVGLAIALIFSIFIHVPTYVTGHGVIVYPGERITANTSAVVERTYVSEGMKVKKGQPLFAMKAQDEQIDLDSKSKTLYSASWDYLADNNDPTAANRLHQAQATVESSRKMFAAKTYLAPVDGVITVVHARKGNTLQAGELAIQITDENALPEIYALMPGTDRPRLRVTQEMQIHLPGFNKNRERAPIDAVDGEIYTGIEAGKKIGPEYAEMFRQEVSVGLIHGKMRSRQFEAGKQKMFYHQGEQVEIEVKVGSKPFLVSLLPALEKYLPE